MIKDKSRILVTGACGSIGSGLVERLLGNGHVVWAFDQSEDGLFNLDRKLKDKYNGNLKLFIGSVRDKNRLSLALEGVDTVFHCAAIKHVYLSEYNPFEAVKTNVLGAQNVIDAKFNGQGCAISISAADLLLDSIIGKPVEELKTLSKKDILDLLGIDLSPVRLKCALLSLKILKAAVYELREADDKLTQ